MDITPKDHRLKLLVALGGCVVMTIIFVLMFGFEVADNSQPKKIGFVNIGSIDEEGWSKSHYEGLKSACNEFGMKLLVRENIAENTGQCPKAIQELIDEGASMIFLASYNYAPEAREIIEKHPEVEFATNSSEVKAKNITSYFARMYQGRYLTGVLAGMRTKSNVIGYVAAMPNSEVYRGINAFTLGVQRTNPNATVKVIWTGSWRDDEKEIECAQKLINNYKADVLTYHVDKATICRVADEMGVDFIGYNWKPENSSEHCITSITCRWNVFYKQILRIYLKSEIKNFKSFWLGVKQGVVELSSLSGSVTDEQRQKLGLIKQELLGDKPVFIGPIYDNKGVLRCNPGEAVSENVLLGNMSYLVRGVEIVE